MLDRQELLRPSFTAGRRISPAIYSLRVGFLASFFGGPIAGAIIAQVNAWRLGRLRRDWPLGLTGLALTVGLAWCATHGVLNPLFGARGSYLAFELGGLAYFALVYSAHRTYYRGMSVLGIKPPNGWALGLSAWVAGQAAIVGLVGWLYP